ncbi:NUDIX domain-containing protein [Deinococcus sp. MIMF12]|uniref:NUDIX domain-containing protein n=1 Tax=Deinococcus rhizophilus TaxID=3049544 RepID=A0ABT7JE99_9DEIO|nr:NUDIX domain-containing protein [Deinococcus rhizophilus]MDL2343378.1 NUDIX domain-containing protein [Deinococcus rhizophilus]
MTDFRFPAPDGTIVNLRVGILCVQGEHLLVCRDNPDFLYVPGGALLTGEPSGQGAQRGWLEETGDGKAEFTLAGVIENFFQLGGREWHETGFYYRISGETLPSLPFAALDNPGCVLEWLPLSELDAHTVYPRCLPELLRMPDGQVGHFVTDDRGQR